MGMGLSRQITTTIMELLRENPQGLSITDIVKSIHINRNTASRYMENLLISGQVEMRHFGMAKIFRLAERLPISAVLSISSELVLQLDNSRRVIFANDPFLAFLDTTAEDVLGKNIEYTVIPSVFDERFPVILGHIRDGIAGTEWRGELSFPGRGFFSCRVIPMVFNEGTRGVSVHFENITDRKRDEERIRDSESRLRSIIRVSPVGIGVVSHRILLEVNDRFCQMTAYAADELIGRTARILYLTDEEYDRVGRLLYGMIRHKGTSSVETVWQRKDKKIIDVLLSLTPLDPADISTGITFAALDITERKQAERLLQERDERLSEVKNAFLSFSPDPVGNINILTGLAGRMLSGTCALYNRLEGGLLCSLGLWNPPPDFPLCDQPEGHVCNDIITRKGDFPTIITDLLNSPYAETDSNVRKYRLQTYIGMPVKIGEKFLGSLCVVYQDRYAPSQQDLEVLSFLAKAVSVEDERRIALQALRESEDRYRTLVEIAPDAIFLHRDEMIFYVNPAAIHLLGARHAEEIIGKRILDFVLPEIREVIRNNIQRDLEGETTPPRELQMIRLDGTPVIVEGRGIKIYTDGKPAVLVTLHDITSRKKREDALVSSEQRYRQLLEQSFDAVIIHKEGIVVVANEAALAMAGASSPEDLIGKSIYDFVHRDSQPLVKSRVSTMLKNTVMLPQAREQFIRCDGRVVDVDVMATGFLDDGVPAVQVVFRKVPTEAK